MKKALQYFVDNEYDKAFARVKQLVANERTIENLHNLAWFYMHEEEKPICAKPLAEEVVVQQPNHVFPYALYGQILAHLGEYKLAEQMLEKALQMERLPVILHNLAYVYAENRKWQQAAQCLVEIAEPSSYEKLYELYYRLQADEDILPYIRQWSDEDDHFIGWSELAELLIEMGEFTMAVDYFEREWGEVIFSSYAIERYSYSLWKLGKVERMDAILATALRHIREMIVEVENESVEPNWTAEDKAERLQELQAEFQQIQCLPRRLQQGYIPPLEMNFYVHGGCLLFGCPQHQHPYY